MKNKIKSIKERLLFTFKSKFPTGALGEISDITNIPVTAVMSKSKDSFPASFILEDLDMYPIENQEKNGVCTIMVGGFQKDYSEEKRENYYSKRWSYRVAKYLDGMVKKKWETIVGSWGLSVAKGHAKFGAVRESTEPTDYSVDYKDFIDLKFTSAEIKEAGTNKIKGYVFVNGKDKNEIKRSLSRLQQPIGITVPNGYWNKSTGELRSKKNFSGFHRIAIVGYKGDKFLFRNSWSWRWGNKGYGSFKFSEMKNDITAAIIYTPIDKKIIAKYKKKKLTHPKFSDSETMGMQNPFLKLLFKMRDIAKIPMYINSGTRSEKKNKEVGGVPESSHVHGFGADIRCTNSTERYILISAAIEAGFNRIGISKDFIHIDNDPTKDKKVIWTYYNK